MVVEWDGLALNTAARAQRRFEDCDGESWIDDDEEHPEVNGFAPTIEAARREMRAAGIPVDEIEQAEARA